MRKAVRKKISVNPKIQGRKLFAVILIYHIGEMMVAVASQKSTTVQP